MGLEPCAEQQPRTQRHGDLPLPPLTEQCAEQSSRRFSLGQCRGECWSEVFTLPLGASFWPGACVPPGVATVVVSAGGPALPLPW